MLRRKALKMVGGTAIGAAVLSGTASADDSGGDDPPKPADLIIRTAVTSPTDAVGPAPKEGQNVTYNPTKDDIRNPDDPFPERKEKEIIDVLREIGGGGPDVVYVRGYVTYPAFNREVEVQPGVSFDGIVQAPSDPGPLDIAEFDFQASSSDQPYTIIYKGLFKYDSNLPGQLELDNKGNTVSNARDRDDPVFL